MFDFHLFLECGVPYNTKSTLRQHKMAIHPSTNGGQSYPCTRPGCTRVFKVAAKLRMHDDVVHKNLEGKYKCQFCPKKFWGKSSLREHTNGVHLNEKPHKCTLCDFSSAYRSKYQVQWYIHYHYNGSFDLYFRYFTGTHSSHSRTKKICM